MRNILSDEEIKEIIDNEWFVFSTAVDNQPRAIIVMPSRVEANRIIVSNIQMNKSIENIKSNSKCFINSYNKDDKQIKIEGIGTVYDCGELFDEIKDYEESNNLPEELKVHSIIVVDIVNVEESFG